MKNYASVFAGTDFESWLQENQVDTITVIGYMTNNCDPATAAAAEPLGIAVELLSDASGASTWPRKPAPSAPSSCTKPC